MLVLVPHRHSVNMAEQLLAYLFLGRIKTDDLAQYFDVCLETDPFWIEEMTKKREAGISPYAEMSTAEFTEVLTRAEDENGLTMQQLVICRRDMPDFNLAVLMSDLYRVEEIPG